MKQNSNLSDEESYLRARLEIYKDFDYSECERSLYEFLRSSFKILEPKKQFLDGWHIQLISEYLELVTEGKIRKLIINIPPRHLKSTQATVVWPVWTWIKHPEKRFLFSSYASDLSRFFSLKRRRIIESEWFLSRWKSSFTLAEDEQRKDNFENNKMGSFRATSTSGSTGGHGSDIIVLDDPLNPEEWSSNSERIKANEHAEFMAATRLDNPATGAVVLVQQRLHYEDQTAVLENHWQESGEEFVKVSLPAVAEKDQEIVFPKSGKVIHRKEGDLLWPNGFNERAINNIKTTFGTYRSSAQLQQRPTPEGGNIVHLVWFKTYKELPFIKRSGWFWDMAVKEKEMNDFSVGLHVGESEKGLYVLDMIRKRMAYPELKMMFKAGFTGSGATFAVVEDKSSGQQIIQEMQHDTMIPVFPFMPQGDKVQRLNLVSPYIEAGKFYLPEDAPWLRNFLDEFEQFPKGPHDDIVDATVMSIFHFTLQQKVGTFGNVTKIHKQKTIAGSLLSRNDW